MVGRDSDEVDRRSESRNVLLTAAPSAGMDVRTVADLSPAERRAFFERDAGVDAVRDDVSEIVDRVRTEGDVALREFSEEFDGVAVGNIDITDRKSVV